MEGDRLLLTPEEVLKRCDENTIGVVVTLGVTFTLQFEPSDAAVESPEANLPAIPARHPRLTAHGQRAALSATEP